MFNKIFYSILSIIILVCINNLYIASHFINKQKHTSRFLFNETLELLPHVYTNLFNGQIYNQGEYIKTNNVDIIIANHINFVDWAPIISTIRQHDNRFIYIIMKKEMKSEYPIVGGILKNCSILLSRDYEEDKEILVNLTKKITDSIILIFPEGKRYNKLEHVKSIEYSLKNNLPVMTKTLYPKMKGIYKIVDELSKKNKLGNLIDCTLIMDKVMGKNDDPGELFKYDKITTYVVINSYNIPKSETYEFFKEWFIKKWYIKNNIIENFNNYEYVKLQPTCKKSFLILLFILFLITVYLLRYHPIIQIFLIILFYFINAQ